MQFSYDYLREYLPPFDPPPRYVPRGVEREIESWIKSIETEDALVTRATRWTYAIFSELDQGRYSIDPGADKVHYLFPLIAGRFGVLRRRISFGAFDYEREQPAIGLILENIYSDLPGEAESTVIGYISFPRLHNEKFPILVRDSLSELHVSHPVGATSACWAQCNQNPHTWGILTAGHVLHTRAFGKSLPIQPSGNAALVRCYYQPVDAAFFRLSTAPRNPRKLNVLSFPAVGLPAVVHRQSAKSHRTIIQVTNNLGVLNTRSIGVYVYLDQPEYPGDSGALITAPNGDAIAIYSGSIAVPAAPNGIRGFAQNFEQAIFALNVTPYQ